LALDVTGEAVRVPGDVDLVGVALRNLIDNALRYSPAGTAVRVGVERDRGSPAIVVADAGPGVAAAELPRLSERFYRGSDPGAEGSGLGLAIVRRVAELHGASLVLANGASGGFVARIVWPAAPS
jgi:signal transduction histidine kinase